MSSTEDVALVLFRTVAGVSGSVVVSQISSGHKNQLRFEMSTADTTLAFDQEEPDSLWLGKRHTSEIVTRDVSQLDPSAAAYVTLPPGHPQGYADCFAAFVADTTGNREVRRPASTVFPRSPTVRGLSDHGSRSSVGRVPPMGGNRGDATSRRGCDVSSDS